MRSFEGWFFGVILSGKRKVNRAKSTSCVLTRDILECYVPEEVLVALLKDHSTGRDRECGKVAS